MDYLLLSQPPDIGSQELQLAATGRVIKAADGVAVMLAAAMLSMMRQRNDVHRNRCAIERSIARQEALVKGREQGRAESAQQVAAAVVARQSALSALAPVLAEIALDAASAVVRSIDRQRCLAASISAVQDLVQRARWARLRVHPCAAEVATAALLAAGPAWQVASVVPDSTLAADGCILETDFGFADASLSVQLDALRSAIAAAIGSALAQPSDAQETPPR